jgi:MscS family membrane protein
MSWLAAVMAIVVPIARGPSAQPADHPLRPPDTSSPRATLQGFIAVTDEIYRQMTGVVQDYARSDRLYLSRDERRRQLRALRDVPQVLQLLDLSEIPPVLKDTIAPERLIQLKEVLDRIDLPAAADMPDREAMARLSAKRWRIPDTEIAIALVESGPRAGEFLVSADTIERLPEFYARVKDLPYKPGPGQELNAIYHGVSPGSATIYDAYLSSPVGLSYIVPLRWMLSLPAWARGHLTGVAAWQWFGLGLGLFLAGLVIVAAHRLGRRRTEDDPDAPAVDWRRLAMPLAIILVSGLLAPLFEALLRLGGRPRIVLEYLQTSALFLSAAWLAFAASVIAGEAIVASERLTIRSLDSQLIRLGTRLVGLAAAAAVLIKGGDELGLPAYSVLAGLGVGGLAVALAAQSTIANLIGSLLIALEKPFRVGQVVRIGGSEGTVEDVGFRSTRIRTPDNSLVSIPSSTVVNTTVENLSVRSKRRQRFFVQVTCDTPRDTLERVVAGIRQLIVDHPSAEAGTCHVRFNNLGESSLDILVIFHLLVDDYAAELCDRETLLLQIMALLEDEGVELAFPTRTLHLATGAESAQARAAHEAPVIGFATRS